MSRVLCVAEKPAIAKALAGALGGGSVALRSTSSKYIKNYDVSYNFPQWGPCQVTVTSVLGHLTDIKFTSDGPWHNVQEQLFTTPMETFIAEGMQKVAKNIQQEAKKSQRLFIWTDCDREGEFIGSNIVDEAKKANPRIQVFRANFNNAEPSHLRQAAGRPGTINQNEAEAVQVRRELDLRTGAAFTRLQSTLLQKEVSSAAKGQIISYGPCQFPTLGFVVDRYFRQKNHTPETFWYIQLRAKANGSDSKPVNFNWSRGRLFDRMAAVLLYERAMAAGQKAKITSVSEKPTKQYKPLPLTTVNLQKLGAKFLHLSGKTIMGIAEHLYNKGYISYPRTETDRYDAAIDLKALVSKQHLNGKWGGYSKALSDGKFTKPREGKHDDKAHPPIHPVKGVANMDNNPDFTTKGHAQVYEFICRHFLATCSDDAHGVKTEVTLEFGPEKFQAEGIRVTAKNYLDVYTYAKWDSKELPAFVQGEEVSVSLCKLAEGKTTAPTLLTEPELIALMDTNGIGTDATMADHIQKIQDREFAVKNRSKEFMPTQLGIALVVGYDRIGLEKSLSKPGLRRETEEMMGSIGQGTVTSDAARRKVVQEYLAMFKQTAEKKNVLVEAFREYTPS